MPRKYKRICPICEKSDLKNLSSHLDAVHDIDGAQRTKYLIIANPMLSSMLMKSETTKENIHKNAQTKAVKSGKSYKTMLTKPVVMKAKCSTAKKQSFAVQSIENCKKRSTKKDKLFSCYK